MADEVVQNPNPTPEPVPPQPVSAPAPEPTPTPAPAQPQVPEFTEKKSHKMMFVIAGILLIAVLVLGVAGYFYYKNSYKAAPTAVYTPPAVTVTPTVATSPTPISQVKSTSDIDKVQSELNSTTDSDLQNDLNQANSEGTNL